MQMMRIQGFSMGYMGFQKPIVQNFSLAAGSPSGGADGGSAPAPAPAPGAQQAIFVPTPTYLFPEQVLSLPMPPEPSPADTQVFPSWAIAGGSMLIGMGIVALILKG